MGLFGFVRDLGKTAVNVAKLPVSLVLDGVTMGGALTDREESYTETNARQLAKNAGDLEDDLYEDEE